MGGGDQFVSDGDVIEIGDDTSDAQFVLSENGPFRAVS